MLEKVYDPRQVEDRIYDLWMKGGYFTASIDPDREPFTIVIPPPNITGQLHMGHALDNTLQDVLIRWRRMQGYAALWVPGTDHASIATEARIVDAMRAEGLSKADLGREKFLERAWEWKEKYGGRIIEQLKKIGCSCDWTRERFTLDEGCSKAVREVFYKLYHEGLIYRGERLVNWCPHCLSAISDAEVEYEEQAGHFWHLRYPVVDTDEILTLATTRPETMLGDTAVAVHPDDARYRHLVGRSVMLPLQNREIPIIADPYVEMDFGTGVVKITPAHDPNDFEVGLRHGLPVIDVMNDDGTMNANAGAYAGLSREACRASVVADLENLGLLAGAEDHRHNVGTCYRCHNTVEPRISLQWFVKMEELAKPAIEAVRQGDTQFVPERFSKIYFNWMENIRDWCISRQLWWGHRIPAYYCADCREMTVTKTEHIEACAHCGSKNIAQDPDTLDTWFSSALWPFSTLGWPDDTADLRYFYPTSVLVTAYDIIFFWVARMIFSGLRQMGEVPFHTVFIHGIVRDDKGHKMSKSLGNGIDPLEVVEQYGADALRFMLASGTAPGTDQRYVEDKIIAARNFCNKIWNAARFVLMNLPEDYAYTGLPAALQPEDHWALGQLQALEREVNDNLGKYELGLAASKVYGFIWDVFCDWVIELKKTALQGEGKNDALAVLLTVFDRSLRLLHPFMPFITEEIWQALPLQGEALMTQRYPQGEIDADPALCAQFQKSVDLITAIRTLRSEMNVPAGKKITAYVETADVAGYRASAPLVEKLAFVSELTVGREPGKEDAVRVIVGDATGYIPLDELVDKAKERARLQKEREAALKELAAISDKLQNEGFLQKAPPALVEAERDKREKLGERLARIENGLVALGE